MSNFLNINNFANFKLIKYIHLFLDKETLFSNCINYFLIIILIISILAIFIFSLREYLTIKTIINNIIDKNKSDKKIKNKQVAHKKRKRKATINPVINNIDSNNRNGMIFINTEVNNKKKIKVISLV